MIQGDCPPARPEPTRRGRGGFPAFSADPGRLAIFPSHPFESTLPGHPSGSIFPSHRSDLQRVDLTEASFRVIPPCHRFGSPCRVIFRVIFPSESSLRVVSPSRPFRIGRPCQLSESSLRVDLSGSSFRVISPSDRSESTFSSRFSVPGRPFRVVLPNHVSE